MTKYFSARRALYRALMEIRDNAKRYIVTGEFDWRVFNPAVGICYGIRKIVERDEGSFELETALTELFTELAMSWPLHSGDPYYPVPYPTIQGVILGAPRAAYTGNVLKKWSHREYGKMRMQLLDFVITKLEKEINNV